MSPRSAFAGRHHRRFQLPRALGAVCALLALGFSSDWAAAQTWVPPRTTPRLRELVAVDRTGEPDWLFGSEDVLGDGLDQFTPAERALDLRSAYAALADDRFWLRAYVSDDAAPTPTLRLYAFVDADVNTRTGGSAAVPEIEASFVDDETPGGYDFVLGVQADTTVLGFWRWSEDTDSYELEPVGPLMAEAEAGRDLDPLQLNAAAHGYLQAALATARLGLRVGCDAHLLLRSARSSGAGDSYLGIKLPCNAADQNRNGLSDVAEQVGDCERDDQCPARGLCIDARCVYPDWCSADTECRADESCSPDGYCRADGGAACSADAECDGLVCGNDDTCAACARDNQCAAGQRCAVSGRCVDASAADRPAGGVTVDNVRVQGGAFTCTLGTRKTGTGAAFVLLGWLAWWGRGRSRAALRRRGAGPRNRRGA